MQKCIPFTQEQRDNIDKIMSYMLTYTVDRIMLPGKAETMTIIMDMDKVAFTQMPIATMKRFLKSV